MPIDAVSVGCAGRVGVHGTWGGEGGHIEQVGAACTGVRVADDVGPSEIFSTSVVVVLKEVTDCVGLAGGVVEHSIEGPAVDGPLELFELGKVVGPIPLEAMAYVEVGTGAVGVRIEAVVGLRSVGNEVETVAGGVNGVCPCVVDRGCETAPVLHLQRGLHGVVIGKRTGLNLVDVVKRNVSECTVRVRREALLTIGDGLAVSAAIRGARDVVELVQIAEMDEVASLRSYVSDLDRYAFGNLGLDVEIVGTVPRRGQLLVHGEDAVRRIVAEDRSARSNRRNYRRCKADAIEGRPGFSRVGVVSLVAYEEVLRGAIVEDADAGSYHQLAVAREIIGDAKARREVLQVPGIARAGSAVGSHRFK